MQYYKVIKDGKVIDVLDRIQYVKYSKKHKRMFNSIMEDAEAIMSSDGMYAWHINTLLEIPVKDERYCTVEIESIDEFEYRQLKTLNLKTPEEIIDSFVLELVESGVL